MGKRVVTFTGATPAGGGSVVDELVIPTDTEDSGYAHLPIGKPVEVDEKVAAAAKDVAHHNVEVETVAAHQKAQEQDEEQSA